MEVKAIIFDLAGVVLQPMKGDFNSLLAERIGSPIQDVERVMVDPHNDKWDLGEISDDEFFTFLLTELKQPLEKKSILARFVVDDFYIDPILLGFIREIHKSYKTALLTNFPPHVHDFMKARWIVEGAFDHIIASCDIKLLKPDPLIYQKTLEILGCQADEAIFIDDREINVQGAEALGIRSVWYQNWEQGIRDIKELLELG
jgi:epoxide hydrolase-like predicted phosphatase